MINSKNFDNIRVIAIFFILLLHTSLNNISILKFTINPLAQISSQDYGQLFFRGIYLNLFKAGTVLFFIISGFLFQMQFHKFNDFFLFVRKKSGSLLLPYFFFFVFPTIFLAVFIEPYFGVKEKISFYSVIKIIINEIFFGAYWFVPALFITLVINFFIKTKDLFLFLMFFLGIWLVAVLNIHFQFTSSGHSFWFIGFFFVFTLGRLIFLYNEQLSNYKILNNKKILLLVCFGFYILSNYESMFGVVYSNNLDHVNTLRFGNIGYSFALFFLFNSVLNNKKWVFLKSYNIYFIYLIHPFVLKVFGTFLIRLGYNVFSYPLQFIYGPLHFLLVLISCMLLHNLFFCIKWNNRYVSSYFFKE